MEKASNALGGKVAVITGAGRGIGQAVAKAYAAAGAKVVCAARTQSQIDDTVHQIEAAGGSALAVRTDVTHYESVQAMVRAAIDTYGGLDIMFINAGGALDYNKNMVGEGSVEAWMGTLNLNLAGAYYCAREAVPHMKAQKSGKIIAVGSGLGHKGAAGASAYAAAKAGLWMLVRVLAQELAPYNVSVNELIPGPVNTFLTIKEFGAEADPDTIAGHMGTEWIKEPADIVPLAMFLASQPEKGPTAQSYSLLRRDG